MAKLKPKQKNKTNSSLLKEDTRHEILGISLIALGILLLISFYLVPINNIGDPKQMGTIGIFAVKVLAGIFGMGRYLVAVLMVVFGVLLFKKQSNSFIMQKLGGMALLFLSLVTFLHLYIDAETFKAYVMTGLRGEGGGLIGAVLSYLMQKGFGTIGTKIILAALAIVSIILITEISIFTTMQRLALIIKNILGKFKLTITNFIYEDEKEEKNKPKKPLFKKKSLQEPDELPIIIDHGFDSPVTQEPWIDNDQDEISVPEPLEFIPKAKDKAGSVGEDKAFQPTNHKITEDGSYRLPSMDILQSAVKIKSPRMNKEITDNIRVLEDTLDSFGVKVKVNQVSCGPAITRFEMQPCPGVKVSKIVNLADDIALNLAAPAVRIEAPIPGKSVIGIEVPKKEISPVTFREVLESPQFLQASSNLTVALGKDISGNGVVADLSSMPHLLIAGSTGSGKSVCMNSLICSILYKAKPSEVKFLMIDPKMVELANYNGLPHLISPVVIDPKKAAGALKWIVHEMENRYSIFASTGVKDLQRFNDLKKGTGEELPQMVVLIDELADLMMVAPNDVEDAICRLAQMARAAGIHLVIATQRPSVDVITGLIKANIPSRIAFAVSSQIDSRTILDMAGAEKLLGRGDMLFYPVGAAKPIRVQGVYVSEEEISSIVSHCSHQAKPEYLDEIFQHEVVHEEERGETDELFEDAAKLILTTGQASVSMIQRRLRVGYTRAARLMDLLESKGIVGGYEGSKPRNILITMEQFERIKENDF